MVASWEHLNFPTQFVHTCFVVRLLHDPDRIQVVDGTRLCLPNVEPAKLASLRGGAPGEAPCRVLIGTGCGSLTFPPELRLLDVRSFYIPRLIPVDGVSS